MGGDNFNPNVYSQGLYSRFEPGFLNVANMFNTTTGQPNYGVPTAPTMPSMGGVLSGVQPYGIQGYGIPSYNVPSYSVPGYDVPDATSLMPTKDWWNSLSGDVKAGAWAPFQEGQENLLETLGGSGVSGSARCGYSGAAGAALGRYMADATPSYAMNLWGMSQPGMMADWQARLGANQWNAAGQLGANQWQANAQLGANQWGANTQLGENQYLAGLQNQQNQQLWQNQLAERSQDYQNEMNRLQQGYQGAMTGWQMPWQMATNYNNLAPSGAYHADTGGTLGSILGSATSLLSPIAMGAGMGLAGGLFGGVTTGINSLMSNPFMGTNSSQFLGYGTNAGMYGAQRY